MDVKLMGAWSNLDPEAKQCEEELKKLIRLLFSYASVGMSSNIACPSRLECVLNAVPRTSDAGRWQTYKVTGGQMKKVGPSVRESVHSLSVDMQMKYTSRNGVVHQKRSGSDSVSGCPSTACHLLGEMFHSLYAEPSRCRIWCDILQGGNPSDNTDLHDTAFLHLCNMVSGYARSGRPMPDYMKSPLVRSIFRKHMQTVSIETKGESSRWLGKKFPQINSDLERLFDCAGLPVRSYKESGNAVVDVRIRIQDSPETKPKKKKNVRQIGSVRLRFEVNLRGNYVLCWKEFEAPLPDDPVTWRCPEDLLNAVAFVLGVAFSEPEQQTIWGKVLKHTDDADLLHGLAARRLGMLNGAKQETAPRESETGIKGVKGIGGRLQ